MRPLRFMLILLLLAMSAAAFHVSFHHDETANDHQIAGEIGDAQPTKGKG